MCRKDRLQRALLTLEQEGVYIYDRYISLHFYHPQTKCAKVMFLHVSVCPRGDGIPACLAGLWGCVYPSMPCRFPGPHPRGSLRRLAGGSPGPHPGGGGEWGAPGPHLGGVSRPTPGGGAIPACTEIDPPPPRLTATAVGGTHPTGMHSCFSWKFFTLLSHRSDILTKMIIVLHQFHYAEYANEVQTLNAPQKK